MSKKKKISRRKRESHEIKHSFVHKIPILNYERKEKGQVSINERSLNPDENGYLKKDLKLFIIIVIAFVVIVAVFYFLIALLDIKIFNLSY